MSTEERLEALRRRVAEASCSRIICLCEVENKFCGLCPVRADEILNATWVPSSLLIWAAANPEAAKGLAEGSMVAVPRMPTEQMMRAGIDASPTWLVDREVGTMVKRRVMRERVSLDTEEASEVYRAMIAASTPAAPSGEAQGDL